MEKDRGEINSGNLTKEKEEIKSVKRSLTYLNNCKNDIIDCSKETLIPLIDGLAYFSAKPLNSNKEETFTIHLSDNNRFINSSLENSISFFEKKLKFLEDKISLSENLKNINNINSEMNVNKNNMNSNELNNDNLMKLDDNIVEIKEKFENTDSTVINSSNLSKKEVDFLEKELSQLKISMLKPIENYDDVEKKFEELILKKKLEKLEKKEKEDTIKTTNGTVVNSNPSTLESNKENKSETENKNEEKTKKESKNVKFADDIIDNSNRQSIIQETNDKELEVNKPKKKKKDVIKLD